MRYLTAHTSIPVPRIIHYCTEADGGGVGSPYILMSRVDGVPLSSVWDDMEDAKREIVLRMVVDILLELVSHRVEKIGTIFQRETDDATKREWYVASTVSSPHDTSVAKAISSRTFTSAVDYWPMPTYRASVIPILVTTIRYTNMPMRGSCAPSSPHISKITFP